MSDAEGEAAMRKLILKNMQSPGDIVMLTAAVRDLHACCPGQFLTDVRTPCPGLWENNPHLTPLDEKAEDVEIIHCEYPLIHQSNQLPYHFLHGFTRHLSTQLELTIEPTAFKGDIHLTEQEINGAVFGEESPQLREAFPFPLGSKTFLDPRCFRWNGSQPRERGKEERSPSPRPSPPGREQCSPPFCFRHALDFRPPAGKRGEAYKRVQISTRVRKHLPLPGGGVRASVVLMALGTVSASSLKTADSVLL